MRRRSTSITVILTLLAALLTQLIGSSTATAATGSSSFPDVPASSPFAADISWLVDQGITKGYPDGSFQPTAPVTRQAFAALLFRLDGQTGGGACATTTAPFPDVPTGFAFCQEITWLASSGITTGYADGQFKPGNQISRQAIAVFLYRYAHTGTDTTSADGPCASASAYPDLDATSGFCEAVRWMAATGPEPITQDTRMAPSGPPRTRPDKRSRPGCTATAPTTRWPPPPSTTRSPPPPPKSAARPSPPSTSASPPAWTPMGTASRTHPTTPPIRSC